MQLMLRKRVRDLMPGGHRAHENVCVGWMVGITVQTSHRDDGDTTSDISKGQTRTTGLAKDMREPFCIRGSKGSEEFFAQSKSKRLDRNEEIRGECASATLSTSLAMTMMRPIRRFGQLEPNGIAETAPDDHRPLAFGVVGGAAG